MRRALMTVARGTVALPAVGAAFMGGYYAGIIDTTVGNITAADAAQTGKRYALIVAPLALETTGLAWSGSTASVAAARTRWDGLSATAALASATYPAANYCAGLTPPADVASAWYLPALDEFELLYRNLKPTAEANSTASSTVTFPGTAQASGTNPSSDPTRPANTTTVPAQTSIAAFQSGGSEPLGAAPGTVRNYWTATESTNNSAWAAAASGSTAGRQLSLAKSGTTFYIRPVRRLTL